MISWYDYLLLASFAPYKPMDLFLFHTLLQYRCGTGPYPAYGAISMVKPGFF